MHARLAACALALSLVACQSAPRSALLVQDEDPAQPFMDPALMEKMMQYMAPGEAHAEIAKGAGSWSVACEMYMAPGAEPTTMEAMAESRMILGGRFLQESFRGQMMGQPFEGQLLLGFHNLDREYFSIWIDTWGTGYSIAQGQKAPDGTLVLEGTMRDAITPQGRPFRHVQKPLDEDHFTLELFDTMPDGTEWKVMEMEYTRK